MGGSEIRRAPLGKRSGAARPWAGPGSTVPGRSLPSKGGDEALWTPGAEAGGREGRSGPQPGVLSLAEASSGPSRVCPLQRGHRSMQLLGVQAAQPQRSPTKGLWVDAQAPLGWEETASSTPLEQAEAGASLGSAAKSCPLPAGFRSTNPAGRAQVTFAWNPRPGSPRGQRNVRVTLRDSTREAGTACNRRTRHTARGEGKGLQGGISTPIHNSRVCSGYSPPALLLRSIEAQAGLKAGRREGAPRHCGG